MSDDGGFVSVSLVRWMLKQIEKETDLSDVRDVSRIPRMVGVKMINRFERIDTLCEEFHKRIEDERKMLGDVVTWIYDNSKTTGKRREEAEGMASDA